LAMKIEGYNRHTGVKAVRLFLVGLSAGFPESKLSI